MRVQEILIENIKCSGCSKSIINSLKAIEGVESLTVDINHQLVTVTGDESLDRSILVNELSRLGYPEQGQNNLLQKAKSYVSCASGKFQNSN